MRVSINAINMSINILVCTLIQDIQTATHEAVHFQELKTYILQGWPCKKEEVAQGIR